MARDYRKSVRKAGAAAVDHRLSDHSKTPPTLSALINTLRVSREAVCEAIGVSDSQMSNYLRGYTPFPDKRRNALSHALVHAIAGMEVAIADAERHSVPDDENALWRARVNDLRASVEVAKAVWELENGFPINDPNLSGYPAALEAAERELRKQNSRPKRQRP